MFKKEGGLLREVTGVHAVCEKRLNSGWDKHGLYPTCTRCPLWSGHHQGVTGVGSGFETWPEDMGGGERWQLLQQSHLGHMLGMEVGAVAATRVPRGAG